MTVAAGQFERGVHDRTRHIGIVTARHLDRGCGTRSCCRQAGWPSNWAFPRVREGMLAHHVKPEHDNRARNVTDTACGCNDAHGVSQKKNV